MRAIFYISLIILPLSLGGCNPFVFFKDDSAALQTSGWAKRSMEPPPPPIYCYDTLADKVCYTRPIEKEASRLSGYYGPDPDDLPAQ